MLPPRRMRPSVLDFPADKALENLRARRLNVSGSGGSRSTLSSVARAKTAGSAAAIARSESGPPASNAAGGGSGHHYHSSGELWVDDKGNNIIINNNNSNSSSRQPASPAGPRRRRPVSASAVREGLEERSSKLKAMMAEATRPGDCEASRGQRVGHADAVRHGGPQGADPGQYQRTRRGGSTNAPGVRRPRSARAALQRPPPVVADFYHYPSSSNGGGGGGGGVRDRERDRRRREEDYNNDRRQQQQQEQQQDRRSRPSSAATAYSPYAAHEQWDAERRGNSRIDADGVRRGHRTREEPRPQGNTGGNETRQSPHDEERAWLRSRCEEREVCVFFRMLPLRPSRAYPSTPLLQN